MNKSVFLLMIVFLQAAPVGRAAEFAQASAAVQSVQTFSQSADGFDSQFNSTIEAYRVGGEANGRRALDLFQLPRSEEWLSQRLGSDPIGKFTKRYNRIFLSFADSLEKTIEDVQRTRGAKLLVSVKPDEPEAPSPPFYGLVPSGIKALQEPPLFYCQFTIRVKGRDRVSWADEFVYDGAAFRFIGFGEQPFWVWEEGSEGSAPKGGSFVQPAVLISRVIPSRCSGQRGHRHRALSHRRRRQSEEPENRQRRPCFC
jgi:hypothetical protein